MIKQKKLSLSYLNPLLLFFDSNFSFFFLKTWNLNSTHFFFLRWHINIVYTDRVLFNGFCGLCVYKYITCIKDKNEQVLHVIYILITIEIDFIQLTCVIFKAYSKRGWTRTRRGTQVSVFGLKRPIRVRFVYCWEYNFFCTCYKWGTFWYDTILNLLIDWFCLRSYNTLDN